MQKSVYEEKKHFNVIDVMIIIGALLIIVALIFRAQIIGIFTSSGKQTAYTVTFEAESVSNTVAEKITDGKEVTWIERSICLGSLSDIKKEAAVIYVPNTVDPLLSAPYKNGTYNKVSSSDTSKITGSFTARGNSKSGCYINGTDLLTSGMTVTLATDTAEITVVITSITEN